MFGLGLGMGIGGPGSTFSPASLPNLVWWTHADTLSASPVSSWSYGAGNATQGTGASQPTWSSSSSNVGGKSSVLYNGSQFLAATSTSALQLTSDLTICSVIYIASYPAGFATIISKGASAEFDAYVSSAGTPTFGSSNTSPVGGTAGTVSTATKTIVTITVSVSGTTVSFYVNGVAKGTGAAGGAGPAATSNAVQIGQRGDAGTTLNGEQPETILCGSVLSAANLTSLHRYLGGKYGISVP